MFKKLLEYGFKPAGYIIIDNNNRLVPIINVAEFTENSQQNYAWVHNDEVIYIGMGTKGTKKRHQEHNRGWNGGSVSGILKAKELKSLILKYGPVQIYAYKCETFTQEKNCFGKKIVEIFSWMAREEQELISIFKPRLNVNGKK